MLDPDVITDDWDISQEKPSKQHALNGSNRTSYVFKQVDFFFKHFTCDRDYNVVFPYA